MPLLVPGRGLEPLYTGPKPVVLPLNDPGKVNSQHLHGSQFMWRFSCSADTVLRVMGSLVKRRRKRMRKKKHKKMLRRTRHQRNK